MKTLKRPSPWSLGPAVVRRLLPHGPAMRMVDGISDLTLDPVRVRTFLHISGTHPVFASHFTDLPLWPGVFTIEGMAQTVSIAVALRGLVDAVDGDATLVADALRAVDDRSSLRPAVTASALEALEARIGHDAAPRIGMLVAVRTKLLRPVSPGVRLDYQATLVFEGEGRYKAEVEASVAGEAVAEGSLTTVDAPV